MLVLSVATGGLSFGFFVSISVLIVEITRAVHDSTCSFSNGITKENLKTMRKKRKKHNKIVLFSRNRLNSIDNEMSFEEFTIIMNKAENYCKLKDNKRRIKSQRDNKEGR